MEVIGGIASILSILKASRTLRTWLNHLIHFGDHVRELQFSLEAFEILMAGLRHAMGEGGISGSHKLQQQANIVLSEAEKVVNNMKAKVLQAKEGQSWNFVKLRLILSDSGFKSLREKIERHTTVLNGIMLVAMNDLGERQHAEILRAFRGTAPEASSNFQVLPTSLNGSAVANTHVAATSESIAPDEMAVTASTTLVQGYRVKGPTQSPQSPALTTKITLERGNISPNSIDSEPLGETEAKNTELSHQDAVRRGGRGMRWFSKNGKISDTTKTTSASALQNCLERASFLKGLAFYRGVVTQKIVPESSDSVRVASSGSVLELTALFRSGDASPTEKCEDGWTLLMNATYTGTFEMVLYLVHMKASVAARDRFGRQASHLALIRSYNNHATELDRERCQLFPNWQDSREEFELTPVHTAVLDDRATSRKDIPSLVSLIEFTDSLNNLPEETDWKKLKKDYQSSVFHLQIVERFRTISCETRQGRRGSFTKAYLDIVNMPDALQGWTPFQWATYAGREKAMKTLLECGANPFLLTPMKRSALHQAAESAQQSIIDFIFEIPPHQTEGWFDIDLQDVWGETAVHVAIYRRSASALKRLLEKGARRDLRTKVAGQVALHYAAWFTAGELQTSFVEMLLAEGGDHVNIRDAAGRPPIFYLLQNPVAVQMLLKVGVDLAVLDNDQSSAIHQACSGDYTASLRLLLASSILPPRLPLQADKHGDIPLRQAIRSGHMQNAMLMLRSYGPGDLTYKNGRSLVHLAVEADHSDFLELCFQQKDFTKGVRTSEGWTTKELAAMRGVFTGRMRELILKYDGFGSFDGASRD